MRYHWPIRVASYSAILAVSLFCSLSHVVGQTLESKLGQTVEAFDSNSLTSEGQLLDFARQFKIPMGIELIAGAEERPAPIHVRNDSVLNVLKTIIKQKPGYDFDFSDGVVNVYATRVVSDARNFLNLRLPKFKIENQSLIGARYYLKLSIQQSLHPSTNYGGGYGGVKLNNDLHMLKMTFSAGDLTVRQILNRLIATQGNALWVVRLKTSERMPAQFFYAQALSRSTTDAAPDFHWEFVALQERQQVK